MDRITFFEEFISPPRCRFGGVSQTLKPSCNPRKAPCRNDDVEAAAAPTRAREALITQAQGVASLRFAQLPRDIPTASRDGHQAAADA
jgi:hypothetical protein